MALAVVATLGLWTQEFEVAPRSIAWRELSASFDERWRLPRQTTGRNLEREMRALANLTFRAGTERRRLGDLVVELRGVGRAHRATWLAQLESRAPEFVADWGEALSQLLLDEYLFGSEWDPARDHPRDGLLTADAWQLDAGSPEPWRALEPRFEQAATLYFADLQTIKRAENDYTTYPDHVGAEYLEIHPVKDGHLIGRDAAGQPFHFVRIFFRCDLPFPFSSYACDLRILNRIGADGHLRTDIYSTSPDFIYMAGRDVYLPVQDSARETVAYLAVRSFGFDIDNVPDGPTNRAEALRSALGNLKRKAERAYRPTASSSPTVEQALSGVRVRGRQ